MTALAARFTYLPDPSFPGQKDSKEWFVKIAEETEDYLYALFGYQYTDNFDALGGGVFDKRLITNRTDIAGFIPTYYLFGSTHT